MVFLKVLITQLTLLFHERYSRFGVVVILLRPKVWLTEWAYAGFFFDLILATAAHHFADHPLGLSFYTVPILFISYFLGNYIRA